MNLIKTTAALAAALTVMSCSQKAANTAEDGYIGPANLTIQDGKMTPEVLLSLGRLSDAQLSPERPLLPTQAEPEPHRITTLQTISAASEQ